MGFKYFWTVNRRSLINLITINKFITLKIYIPQVVNFDMTLFTHPFINGIVNLACSENSLVSSSSKFHFTSTLQGLPLLLTLQFISSYASLNSFRACNHSNASIYIGFLGFRVHFLIESQVDTGHGLGERGIFWTKRLAQGFSA